MNPRRVLSLFLILLALATGGCKTQHPSQAVDVAFTLKTAMLEGRMVFVGVGGEIDGMVNPDLNVTAGESIRVTLVNDDGVPHDFAIPDLGVHSALISSKTQTVNVIFRAGGAGEFTYYCTVAGHRQMGMEGRLLVSEP